MTNSPPKRLYSGRFLNLESRGGWEFAARAHPLVVVLVAWTDAGQLVLVEQYRPPIDSRAIELPAGLVGDLEGQAEEDPLAAAGRELEEETGFRAATLQPLMTCPTSAGMSNEQALFVRASGLVSTGPGGGDDSEDITVHCIEGHRIDQWLHDCRQRGLAVDPKIFTALYWSRPGGPSDPRA